MPQQHQINRAIRVQSMLVIDEKGNKLGEMSKRAALEKAAELGMDLVLIAPTAVPPVAKLMDYGRFSYEQNKRDKDSKKRQVQVRVKEVYVKPNIGAHDLEWRAENAKRWMAEGNRVKFTVQTYGRLTLHEDLVHDIYRRFLELLGGAGKPEGELKRINPKNHEVIIAPVKNRPAPAKTAAPAETATTEASVPSPDPEPTK